MTSRRVVLFTPHYLPAYRGGGPIRTIAAMVAAYAAGRSPVTFRIVTGDHDWGEAHPLPVPTDRWVNVDAAAVRYIRSGSIASWLRAYVQVRILAPDVLYLNGVFPLWTSIVPAALHRVAILRPGAFLIAPRGEFGAGALVLKARKKRAFLALARLIGLYRGAVWHASTPQEANEIRAVFPKSRVLIRENESELPRTASRHRTRSNTASTVSLAFVSRLSPKKGLHLLLEALTEVTSAMRLDIYGDAAEAEYLEQVNVLADRARQAGHRITFHGAIPHNHVRAVFAAHDAFVFPTAHENFGHVIAEALSVGCPVLVPDSTPWSPLVASGAGVVVDAGGWPRALAAWAAKSSQQLADHRAQAADGYDRWSAARRRESVFDMLEVALSRADRG